MRGASPGERRGGRQKGTLNKLTVARRALVEKAISNSKLTPLECLLNVMNGATNYTEKQIDAAKAAAPYVHPRKVDHGEDRPANNTTVIIGGITDADRIEAVRELLGKDRK